MSAVSSDFATQTEEGRKAFASGDYIPALAVYEQAFESEEGQRVRAEGMRGELRDRFLEYAQLHQLLEQENLRAVELCEELAENDGKVFGVDSHERALTLLECADAYQEMEFPDLARASELVAAARGVLGETGVVLYAQGSIAFDRDQYKEAVEVLTRALEVIPEDDREKRALVYNVLSVTHAELNDFAAAMATRLMEMPLVEGIYGREHPEYATSLESLAELYLEMRARAKSMQVTTEVIRIRRAKLGEHEATLDAEDDYKEAEKALAKNLSSKTNCRVCFRCNKVAEGLKKCGFCKQAWWCGEECQAADKERHTAGGECKEFEEMTKKALAKLEAAKAASAAKGKKKSAGKGKKSSPPKNNSNNNNSKKK